MNWPEDFIDKNSMLYWYPKIVGLSIPKPITYFTTKGADWDKTRNYLVWSKRTEKEIESAIRKVGLPVFLRTDLMSCKHEWGKTCFLKDINDLKAHLSALAEGTYLADIIGKPVDCFVVRQYIPMKNLFTAFWGKMPVNPEIRFFIKEGKVLCWHWYWIEDAIEKPSNPNWKEIIAQTKRECYHEIRGQLTQYAEVIAEKFKDDGAWSVDFCQAENGIWYLIDLALATESWHPEDCEELKGIREVKL